MYCYNVKSYLFNRGRRSSYLFDSFHLIKHCTGTAFGGSTGWPEWHRSAYPLFSFSLPLISFGDFCYFFLCILLYKTPHGFPLLLVLGLTWIKWISQSARITRSLIPRQGINLDAMLFSGCRGIRRQQRTDIKGRLCFLASLSLSRSPYATTFYPSLHAQHLWLLWNNQQG